MPKNAGYQKVKFQTTSDEIKMKIFIFPARNGESILVETVSQQHVLIDGGYGDTYTSYIKPFLHALLEKNSGLDLVVATHIDTDHISGLLKLFNDDTITVPIKNIWHNAYRHIQSPVKIIEKEPVWVHHNISKEVLDGETKKVGAEQGCTLAAHIAKRNLNWNSQFDGNVITKRYGLNLDGIKLSVLTPTTTNIDNLCKFWKRELIKKGLLSKAHSNEFWDDAYEFCLSKDTPGFKFHTHKVSSSIDLEEIKGHEYDADKSPTNGSSISFVLETEGKKILMLGDAHAEDVVCGLKELYGDSNVPYIFDAIKLSHHGSYNNNSSELISMIDSEKWIISTDGKIYNHPDIEVLAHIITKGGGIKRKLYFNYELPVCEVLNNSELHSKYNFEVLNPKTNTEPIIISL